MSRIAIHARPIELRTMFFAASANTTTTVSVRKYFARGVSNAKPRISILCVVITPEVE